MLLLKGSRASKSITSAMGFLRSFSDLKSSTPLTKVDIRSILAKCQAVCFDVDSTVITEEGIDQLAAFKGAGAAVAELTRK